MGIISGSSYVPCIYIYRYVYIYIHIHVYHYYRAGGPPKIRVLLSRLLVSAGFEKIRVKTLDALSAVLPTGPMPGIVFGFPKP